MPQILPDGWKHPKDAPRDGTYIVGYGRLHLSHFWREASWHGVRHTEPVVRETYYSSVYWQVPGGTMDLLCWKEMESPPIGVDAGEIEEVMHDRGPIATRYSRVPPLMEG